jgi:hypothetical protein
MIGTSSLTLVDRSPSKLAVREEEEEEEEEQIKPIQEQTLSFISQEEEQESGDRERVGALADSPGSFQMAAVEQVAIASVESGLAALDLTSANEREYHGAIVSIRNLNYL